MAEKLSAYYWAHQKIQRVDNRQFNLTLNPYLADIFDDEAKEVVVRKSSQTRLSMTMIMRFIHRVGMNNYNGIYYFPTDTALYPFMQSRFDKLVEMNPKLRAMFTSIDNTTVKQIGQAIAYFFGIAGKTQKESSPADCEVFDEFDLMGINDVEIARERMQDSPYKYADYIGNPTIPDYGTDALFQDSDQKFWTIKCDTCNTWNECDVNTERMPFPECIIQGFLACRHCKGKLDVLKGHWVPKKPGMARSGYAVSRIFVHNADYEQILKQSKEGLNIANFYNRKLGIPWSDKQTRIDAQHIFKMCGLYPMWQDGKECTAGIDVNPTAGHHIVISRKGSFNKLRDVVFMGVVENLEDVVPVLRDFGVRKFVIDGNPDPEGANRVIKALGNRGFRCYYIENQKDTYKWDDEQNKVNVNRTESLDASQRLLRDLLINIPRRCQIVETFAEHCANIARILETNEKTGIMTARYVQLGSNRPDHFRHAFNYDAICWYNGEGIPVYKAKISLSGGFSSPNRTTGNPVNKLKLGWTNR